MRAEEWKRLVETLSYPHEKNTDDKDTGFEIEKMRDLSHVRNPGEEEIRRLYEKNALSVELWESRDVPVSLDS